MDNNFIIIDALQYNNFSQKIFEQINQSGVNAIHVTISYHEDFKEMIQNLINWNRIFEQYSDYVFQGFYSKDILKAKQEKKTAIFFGFQNPSPIEDNIGLLDICYQLGIRFIQMTYNNQSLLGTGCFEQKDSGITTMGKQVIKKMNQLGMIIDLSHAGQNTTIDAIEFSEKPVAISHANPFFWCQAKRNIQDDVIKLLCDNKGMLGFSLYPHHLLNKSECSLESFCKMIAISVEKFGINHFGIGSDLCQNQPDSIVSWMRNGTWSLETNYGEGSKEFSGFPKQPKWFENNLHFGNIIQGLKDIGMNQTEIRKIMGENWLNFFKNSFG